MIFHRGITCLACGERQVWDGGAGVNWQGIGRTAKGDFMRRFLLALLVSVVLAGCSVDVTVTNEAAAATPIPTYTPTLSPSATPAMTRTRNAAATTATPSTTPPPVPTATRSDGLPTPLPPPVWAEGITPLLTLDHGEASWSPTSNEVLLAVCPPYWPSEMELPPNGTIYYAAAPEFTTLTPVFTDFYCPGMLSISDGVDITWSQDGQQAIFVGVDPENYYDLASLDWGPATVWSWQPGQTAVGTIISETHTVRVPSILTWVDEETLLLSSYASGGNYEGLLLNVRVGEVSSNFYAHGQGDAFRPSSRYIGTGEGIDFTVTVMAIAIDLLWSSPESYVSAYDNEVLWLTRPQANQLPIPNSAFQDWLPDTDTMLVRTWLITDPELCLQEQPCVEDNQLQWWDVAADQLQPFLPFGLNATLSPNGNIVAVTTAGPVEISSDGQPLQELPAPENTDSSNNYLLLVDRVNGKVLLPSLPARYGEQFSPDGQYLAFYSPQQLLRDTEGRPTGDALPEAIRHLNLLDLTDRQLFTAVPVSSDSYPLSFLWSPDSRRILFRDASENLMVYDLPTQKLIAITVNGKNQISRASWSFNGQYLSLELHVDFETEKVVIIHVPE